jgi:hypothetical protein
MLALVVAATGCGASAMPAAAAPSSVGPAADAPAAMSESTMSVQSTSSSRESAPMPQSKAAVAQPTPTQASAKTASPDAKKTDAQAPDFLIMYTGDVAMTVDDGKIPPTIDKIIDAAESVGGHLAGRRDLSVTIRVPSAHFRDALNKVGELGEITHQSVTAEDVSEEYHDAEVRLANMKATRQRLQDFLAKSANMNDMLTLERELERVSMDIDRIEGRMRFLREHVAFSTLTVGLTARPKSQAVVASSGGGGGKTVVVSAPRIMHLNAEWLDNMGVDKLVN